MRILINNESCIFILYSVFMKLALSNRTKIFLVLFCLLLSIIGFLVKLPSAFRHIDKELHTAFYFLAAAFLNILFTNNRISIHVFIFLLLFLFGISIEFAQDYSNKLFHTRIHGRFDWEDVQANVKGLLAFSILWIIYRFCIWVYKKAGT